jgi:hypothetical protein
MLLKHLDNLVEIGLADKCDCVRNSTLATALSSSSRVAKRSKMRTRIFSSITAFQEIHMYLGGVLGFGTPHVPVPDNRTMRDIKGFDNWSFKKRPSEKKRRKKKNGP